MARLSGDSLTGAPVRAIPMPGSRYLTRARRLLHDVPVLPASILLIVVVAGLGAPWLAPYSNTDGTLSDALKPPFWMEGGSTAHLFGTDNLGRDVFSRLIWGARVSLLVGFISVGLAGVIGVTLGVMAGYFGKAIEIVVMRWLDIQMSIPSILLALLLTAVISPGLRTVIVVVIIVYWTSYARLVRAETLSVKQRDYVALARVAGVRHRHIIRRHILPNIINTVIVIATLQLGIVIIFEASLSFLGLGVQPPQVAWGSMLADGRQFVRTAWWISVFPGLAIMMVVLSINLLGDWLRDRLDPKLRQV